MFRLFRKELSKNQSFDVLEYVPGRNVGKKNAKCVRTLVLASLEIYFIRVQSFSYLVGNIKQRGFKFLSVKSLSEFDAHWNHLSYQ